MPKQRATLLKYSVQRAPYVQERGPYTRVRCARPLACAKGWQCQCARGKPAAPAPTLWCVRVAPHAQSGAKATLSPTRSMSSARALTPPRSISRRASSQGRTESATPCSHTVSHGHAGNQCTACSRRWTSPPSSPHTNSSTRHTHLPLSKP